MAKSGSDGHWMAGAVKHPGSFRKAMGKKAGQKITSKDISKGLKSKSGAIRRKAALAKTFAKFRGKGKNPGIDMHKGVLDMDKEMRQMGGSLTVDEAANVIAARRQMNQIRSKGRKMQWKRIGGSE